MGGRSTTSAGTRRPATGKGTRAPRRADHRGQSREAGSRSNGASSDRFRVRRFDADRKDRELTFDSAISTKPSERQLLWIDVVGDLEADEIEALGKRFDLDAETRGVLTRPIQRPHVAVHGAYMHLSVGMDPIPPGERRRPWLDIVGGHNVVLTRQDEASPVLDDIDERIKADTTLGAAEGAEFVAIILEGILTSCFEAVDEIEDQIDRLDTRSLRDDGRRELLSDLVALRHRIARLRRTVTGHRAVFAALAGPDIRQVVESPNAATDLQAVASRYEAAVGAVEASRDALIGSFDVYMTRTAQRTNDVMKILTIATVLLLPGSVIAGFLGMNVIVPLNADDPTSFWLVVGAVGVLAAVVLGVARLKRWI